MDDFSVDMFFVVRKPDGEEVVRLNGSILTDDTISGIIDDVAIELNRMGFNEKLNNLNRQQLIDWLVADDISTIQEALFRNDNAYLSDILMYGKSYQQWSDAELIAEIKERELDKERVV